MNRNYRREIMYLRVLSLFICLCLATISLGGCASLRKKFTRKKKEKTAEQAFVPVLDPIDYPPPSVSPPERYRYHYSLWKVWQRDLVQNIESRESDKNQKFLVGQIIAQLEEMKKWLVDAKKDELTGCINEWSAIAALYAQPAAMRNAASVRKKVEAAGKEIRNRFNPEVAGEFLISP